MKRERKAWIVDRIRGFAQGILENAEVSWQEWAEDFTDEEQKLANMELMKLSERIGNTRTFVSVEYSND